MSKRPQAAYIHIPFCVSKCWYCDFNSYAGLEPIFDDYVSALIIEIERAAPGPPDGLDSLYLGGGTPTLMDVSGLGDISKAVSRILGLAPNAEITIEANPGTVDEAKLTLLREAGFNRLSLGIQSFDDEFLRSIGRVHDCAQAIEAYDAARRAGFANVGIDLIYALPSQTVRHWSRTLDTAISLSPEHISLYGLTIEQGTRFGDLRDQGRLLVVDEDTDAQMYELAIEKLTSAGYEHYEVSNFARPGYRSRHNSVYWLNEPYFGFGAGATSYVDGVRSRRIAGPRQYVEAINSGTDAIEFSETLDQRARLGETMVQGLRMLDGVDAARVRHMTGLDPLSEFASEIDSLTARGLIQVTNSHIRVTHQGLLLLNYVAEQFV